LKSKKLNKRIAKLKLKAENVKKRKDAIFLINEAEQLQLKFLKLRVQ